MRGFYHKQKMEGREVPRILGLTASPVMRSDPGSLTSIEETLDAICRTPTKNRAELRLHVKLPILSQAYHQALLPEASLTSYTRTIASLGQAYKCMKISEDPYVISLLKEDTEKSRRKLDKVRLNHKTTCQDQMKNFLNATLKLCRELGAWAADYYVSGVVANATRVVEEAESTVGFWDIPGAEKQYLAKALRDVEVTRNACDKPDGIPLVTDKVSKLIEVLLRKTDLFSGIVFVQERATASVLAHLLSVHPDTRDRFRVGTIVGTSKHSYRARYLGEVVDFNLDTLSAFRAGRINLVVATSVLEEGIDIPACNLVICFQKPANLKSFVQRRGRARQQDSELVLLLDSATDKVTEWEQLEADMKRIYSDEMRTLEEILVYEDAEEHENRTFCVPSMYTSAEPRWVFDVYRAVALHLTFPMKQC